MRATACGGDRQPGVLLLDRTLACVAAASLGCAACSLPAVTVGASAQWAHAGRRDRVLGASAWRADAALAWRSSRTPERGGTVARSSRTRAMPDPPCALAAACSWAAQAEHAALAAGRSP